MTTETYKLTCHSCGKEIELLAAGPPAIERRSCPKCGVALLVDWRGKTID